MKKQVGAIPVRHSASRGLQVLLVTSRETRRWVIPKGWPWPDLPDHRAAAMEAWEEAGVRGVAHKARIGSYAYGKRRKDRVQRIRVDVYLLDVTSVEREWPEKGERRRVWMSPAKAAAAVAEPKLKILLERLGAR